MNNGKEKKVIALIGGIASGKSAVSDILASLGAYIIDADVVSRSVTSGSAEKEIMKRFPSCVVGDTFDRKLLKERVFSDEKELKALNDITHPLIIKEIHRLIAEHDGIIVVVMPLPVEIRRYHTVLGVYTPMDMRIERLKRRDNITDELAKKIIASQLSDEKFAELSDFTFINDSDKEKLRRSVESWWRFYIEK